MHPQQFMTLNKENSPTRREAVGIGLSSTRIASVNPSVGEEGSALVLLWILVLLPAFLLIRSTLIIPQPGLILITGDLPTPLLKII